MTTRALLITGATGKQGGSVINALLKTKADFNIIALTRNTESASAKSLAAKSSRIKLISGNLEKVDDVFRAAKKAAQSPIWGVFSVQVAMGDGQNAASEERQGKALIDAALSNGVKHFVYSSVDRGGSKSDSDPTKVPHFASKHNIEQHLFAKTKASGNAMTWSVLRPVAFLENLTPDFFGKVFVTSWEWRLRKTQTLQLVSTTDIGFFAAQSFTSPTQWSNKSLSIAGDSLTYSEFASIFQSRTGQPLPTTFKFIAALVNWGVKEFGEMYKWFRDVGYGADVEELRRLNPDLKDFGAWLDTESSWKKGGKKPN